MFCLMMHINKAFQELAVGAVLTIVGGQSFYLLSICRKNIRSGKNFFTLLQKKSGRKTGKTILMMGSGKLVKVATA